MPKPYIDVSRPFHDGIWRLAQNASTTFCTSMSIEHDAGDDALCYQAMPNVLFADVVIQTKFGHLLPISNR